MKIESKGYHSYEAPLSYLTRDTLIKKINLIKMNQAYYNSYPLSNEFGSNLISVKIPYRLDSFYVIIGITKYGMTHITELKKIIEQLGLQCYEPDLALLNSKKINSGIRLSKKNNQKFASFNCEELEKLRNYKKMIYVAGPKIILENIFPHDTNSFMLFTNTIYVKIKPAKENEFIELIKTQELKIVNKYTPNNEPYFIVESSSDVGEGINNIAKKLLEFEIITYAHPVTKNLFPKIKGQAPF